MLFDAAGRGHKSGVQLLLDEGANIEAINKNGDTALNVAVSRVGHPTTQVLLEYHANPKHSNFHGSTALHLAVASPSISIARSLLEAGANVNATDNDGQSPLHRTVIEGEEVHERILRLLIDHTAQVEIQDNDGNTPLHYSVFHKRPKMVRILLGAKANLRTSNWKGQTPYEIAQWLPLCGNGATHETLFEIKRFIKRRRSRFYRRQRHDSESTSRVLDRCGSIIKVVLLMSFQCPCWSNTQRAESSILTSQRPIRNILWYIGDLLSTHIRIFKFSLTTGSSN